MDVGLTTLARRSNGGRCGIIEREQKQKKPALPMWKAGFFDSWRSIWLLYFVYKSAYKV